MKNTSDTAAALDLARAALAAAEAEHREAQGRIEQLDRDLAAVAAAYDADPSDKGGRAVLAARGDRDLGAMRLDAAARRVSTAREGLAAAERAHREARLAELATLARRDRVRELLADPIAAVLAARAAERAALARMTEILAEQNEAHREAAQIAAVLGASIPTIAIGAEIAETMLDLAELDAMSPDERGARDPHHATRKAAILRRCAIRLFGPAGYDVTRRHVKLREALDLVLAGASLLDLSRLEVRREAGAARAELAGADDATPIARAHQAFRLLDLLEQLGEADAEREELGRVIADGDAARADLDAAMREHEKKKGTRWTADDAAAFWRAYVPRSRRPIASAAA
jgi:hypothetical protein